MVCSPSRLILYRFRTIALHFNKYYIVGMIELDERTSDGYVIYDVRDMEECLEQWFEKIPEFQVE